MMKKLLLILTIGSFVNCFSQSIFTYGFTTQAALTTDGWIITNQSTSLGIISWGVPAAPLQNNLFGGVGHSGGATSYACADFDSVGTAANQTISNWLISPSITVKNGDIVKFWTRTGRNTVALYADNLQMRMSSAGTTVNPVGPSGIGSFTVLCNEINPTLNLTSYPLVWTEYSYIVTSLPSLTPVKFAFRYYVTDGGANGANSEIMGIDDFSVDRPLNTNEFFKNNFAIYPNPTIDILTIANENQIQINTINVTDVNGRIVKEIKGNQIMNNKVDISDLNSGLYLLDVITDKGTGSSKLVKS
jgi:hypothetical protein